MMRKLLRVSSSLPSFDRALCAKSTMHGKTGAAYIARLRLSILGSDGGSMMTEPLEDEGRRPEASI